VELALAMFCAMVFIRSDWAFMPEATTAIEVEKSILNLLAYFFKCRSGFRRRSG
jgi:hypothetical protein